MKLIAFGCLFIFMIPCEHEATDQTIYRGYSIHTKSSFVADNSGDIFADKYFTFLHLDSINEDMLVDTTAKQEHKYISSIKRFTKEHCNFFKIGCRGYFVDDEVFLVSKQKWIGNFLPVIIHDSGDFNCYHSELYVLDKNFNKIDLLTVSLSCSGIESDEPSIYYETKIFSKFEESKIITTEIEYWHYQKNDSTVIVDKAITYRQIGVDGKITILKKDKLI